MFKVEPFYITNYNTFAEEFQQYLNMQADRGWIFQSGLIVLDNVIYVAYKNIDKAAQIFSENNQKLADDFGKQFAESFKREMNKGENDG